MKRIAVIGDSHAAMLYSAIKERLVVIDPFELTFFQWRSAGTKELVLRAGDVEEVIGTIKIMDKHNHILDVNCFDGFLLCGLGFSLRSIIGIYEYYRHDEQHQAKYLVSDACWDAAIRGQVQLSLAMKVVEKLRMLTNREIILMPTPLASEYFLEADVGTNLYRLCIENGDAIDIGHRYAKSKSIWHKMGVKLADQPQWTVCKHLLTDGKYCLADPSDRRPESAFSRRDLTHMNGLFGAIMLSEVLKITNL